MGDSVDLGVMRQIVERQFVREVYDAFGEVGTAALREVLNFLPQYYALANPDLITGTLWVMRSLKPDGLRPALSGSMRVETRIDRLPRKADDAIVLELLDNGAFHVWESPTVNLTAASGVAVVYRFALGREEFIVRDELCPVLNPAPEHISVFARPTFSSLTDALEDYRRRLIRTSTCYIFREAWEDPNKRLFFSSGAERRMRRSLHQYLPARLRDVDVLPEQIVDETHPVDIKVTWPFTRAEALIEIKWLGKSRSNGKIVAYWDERAREGAAQLAFYLDKYHTSNPNVDTKGYLVVVDGRRYGLADDATSISMRNGMYYEKRDVEFNPKYHEVRGDFERPIRMFAEPICEPGEETT